MSSSTTRTTRTTGTTLNRLTNGIRNTDSLAFMLISSIILPFPISTFTVPLYTSSTAQQLYRLITGILNSNSIHFIAFSLLFLPLTFTFTFSSSAATQFHFFSASEFGPINLPLIKTIRASSQNILTLKNLITILTFTCLVILPTVAGIALITYSTNQAINRKPLTFSSTLKSLTHSYIPLLHTITAASITIILLLLAFTLSSTAVTESVKLLGFDFNQVFFSTFVNLIASYALAVTILFFIVICGSAAAITVLESKSGFESLQQSANQSAEFRHESFSVVVITRFGIVLAMIFSIIPQIPHLAANWMTLIVKIGAIYMLSSLTILHYVVANTVLYAQYKVSSGEEIAKTAAEGEVSVNERDGEVSHEVSHELATEETNGGFRYMFYLLDVFWAILFSVLIYSILSPFF